MLVILSGMSDPIARSLVAYWSMHDCRLLTPADLSRSGWRHYIGAEGPSTAVVGGLTLNISDIDGVVTRLPCVLEHELIRIAKTDRSYAAAEMTAFLTCWLSHLKCPVLNPPTATCLAGPGWREERWAYEAALLGISVATAPNHTCGAPPVDLQPVTVTVVGPRYLGQVPPLLAVQARKLADAAGVELLSVTFSGRHPGAAFLHADPWPDLSSRPVANAVLGYLLGGTERPVRAGVL